MPLTVLGRNGLLASFIALATIAGCAPKDAELGPEELIVTGAAPIVSTESELLSRPSELALSPHGDLLVLDRMVSQIVSVPEDGADPSILTRAGSGPGELKGPTSIDVIGDTLWVVDKDNGRIQALDLDGNYLAAHPAPHHVNYARAQVLPGREILVGSRGHDSSLVVRVGAGDTIIARIGTPVAPPVQVWDFGAMKETMADGGVPAAFRNNVSLRATDSDAVWVALLTEATLRKYTMDGELLVEVVFDEPELDAIRAEFFRRNTNNENRALVYSLAYFTDLEVVGDEAWLLMNRADTATSIILAVSEDGTAVRRIIFGDILGAGSFVVDERGALFYAAIPNLAQVVEVGLPERAISNAP